MCRPFIIILFLFVYTSLLLTAQDTIPQMKLEYNKGLWLYNKAPFTGVGVNDSYELTDFYNYAEGKVTGYRCLYEDGSLAGIHTYKDDEIHLEFFSRTGQKTMEYYQKVLDGQTYEEGERISYYGNGKIKTRGKYVLVESDYTGRGGNVRKYQSVKDGKWHFYDEEGELEQLQVWNKGKMVRQEKYKKEDGEGKK